jgi:hypothetical protein
MSFTRDDRLDASGDRSPDFVSIEPAKECDGELCGLRPELVLPAEQYAVYMAVHAERPAVDHSHLVTLRAHPGARHYVFAITK